MPGIKAVTMAGPRDWRRRRAAVRSAGDGQVWGEVRELRLCPLHGPANEVPQAVVSDLGGTGRACPRPGVGDGFLEYREPLRNGQSWIRALEIGRASCRERVCNDV